MANHKQALKRIRQNIKRRDRNRQRRSLMKTAIRKAREAMTAGQEDSKVLFQDAVRRIAKARTKGLLHASTAARKVAKVSRAFHRSQNQG